MAGDWIKIRRGLRHSVKVVAIARFLSTDRAFMDWWATPVRHECRHTVTEIVTIENVTRVTVCALAELWASLNEVVKEDCTVSYMSLATIDDITGIPSFGASLVAVGWVVEQGNNGLLFPNFYEWNTPDSERRGAKSDAQRAREYRQRRKGDTVTNRHESSQKNVTPSRDEITERNVEERRGEDNTPLTPQVGVVGSGGLATIETPTPDLVTIPIPPSASFASESFAEFWSLFPRKERQQATRQYWRTIIGSSPEPKELVAEIIAAVKAWIPEWESREAGKIPSPCKWLEERRWTDAKPEQKKHPVNLDMQRIINGDKQRAKGAS